MEKKFRVLRFIGSVYKILGIIVAVLTIVGSLGLCLISATGAAFYETVQDELGLAMDGVIAGVIGAGSILVSGAIWALMLYALGEGIFLLISLEENTRRTAFYMQQYSTEPVVPEV